MDRGEFRDGDVAPVLAALEKFDAIFAVLQDDDAEKLRALGIAQDSAGPDDAEIEALVAERQAARKRRDFAASDRIRDHLPGTASFWKILARNWRTSRWKTERVDVHSAWLK